MRSRWTMAVGLLFLGLAMAACAPGAPPEVPVGASGEPDPVLVVGRNVFSQHCVSCHDRDGSGGIGKSINDGKLLAKYPEISIQTSLIANGLGGRMPAFREKLTTEEIEAVSRYVREVL